VSARRGGLKNGSLLTQAEEFGVLLTMDSNMRYQQNLANYRIAVMPLKLPAIALADTHLSCRQVLAVLPRSSLER